MTTSFYLHDFKPTHSLSDFDLLHDPRDHQSKLGLGSFATVKLAREKKTGKLVALKLMDTHPAKATKGDLQNLKTEIQIHKDLDHPHIIKFYGYIQQGNLVYLILDYAENGNLYMHLRKRKNLSEREIFKYFYQTCQAINYLHDQDIVHRDIKPENLLLDKDFNIKVCDFGWSSYNIREERRTFCGTYEYMAPEIVHKKYYDYRVDIWALGVLLYELIHNKAPYVGRSMNEIKYSLSKGQINFHSNLPQDVRNLILKILRTDPNNRLSMRMILSDPWVIYHSEREGMNRKNTYHEDIAAHRASVENTSMKTIESTTTESSRSKPLNIITQPIQQFFGGVFGSKKETTNLSTSNKFPRAEGSINKILHDRSQNNTGSFRSNTLTNGYSGSSAQMVSPHKAVYLHTEGSEDIKPSSSRGLNQKRIFDNNVLPPTFNERLNRILDNLNAKKGLPVQNRQDCLTLGTPSKNYEPSLGYKNSSRGEFYARSPINKFYSEIDNKENVGSHNIGLHGSFKASIISNPEFGSPKVISYRNTKEIVEQSSSNNLNNGRKVGAYHSFLEQHKQMMSPKLSENREIRAAVSQEKELRIEPRVMKRPIFAVYSKSTKNAFDLRREDDFKNSWFSPKNRSIYNQANLNDIGIGKKNF